MSTRPIEAVIVVIPVQNEEDLLRRCLDAIACAVHRVSGQLDVSVTLVLDSCVDGSAGIASTWPLEMVSVQSNNVGASRRVGVETALAQHSARELDAVWIANSDADSVVPPNWLTHQVKLANSGAALMIGTVRPDPADLDPTQLEQWSSTHLLSEAGGHVYGANLGVRASVYRAAGGFAPVEEHEDVLLVEQVRALGAPIVETDECWVLTSGRAVGRTPGGFARYMREDLSDARA